MAQLKDSLITGDLRVTGTIYGDANLSSLNASGTGLGTNGQILKSTGTGLVWADAAGTHNHDSAYVNVTGDTMTGALLVGTKAMTVSAGKVTEIGNGQTGLFKDGIAISNPTTKNDAGWIRVTGTGESDTVMEIATGDDAGAGEKIVVRQYNTSNVAANELVLLNTDGGTVVPKRLTIASGKPINQILTGTGTAAADAGSGNSPRYTPAKWTFNTGLTVTDGDIFTIKIPVAGHNWGVYMSVDNGSHYYPLVLNGTGRFTTHFGVNTYIQVVFEATGSAASMTPLAGADSANGSTITGGVFRVFNYYDSGNNYNWVRPYYIYWKTKTALYRYQLLFTQDEQYLLPANAVDNNTGTTKTLTTEEFDPFGDVYYYGSTTTVTAGNKIGDNTLYTTNGLIDLRYSFNTGTTLTAQKGVYIVMSPQSSGKVKLHTTPISQTLPTTDDGLLYKYIGQAYDTYRIQLIQEKPVYIYKSGKLTLYAGYAGNVDWANISGKPSSFTPSSHTHGNITNDGKIGTTANQAAYTTTNGVVTAGTLPVAAGGTGATTAADARTNLGITPANIGISATTTSVTVGSTTFNKYTHPTTSGNKHIPSGGSSGQFLGWSADGTATWVNNPNVDTKNTAGSTNSDSKLFLIGATSQAANPQTYSDSEVYTTNGTLTAKILSTSAGINANTANSGTAGGVSLYGTTPTDYGITMRNTGTSSGQLGKHGYVQGDWAGYFSFTGATNRGYIFRHGGANVASISGLGHAVFNGSVTVGGNTANTSGARMEYDATVEAIGFTFN